MLIIMSQKFFIKIATDPDVDPVKCVVGMACAAQAVTAGHDVDVFFAAAGVRNLNLGQFEKMAENGDVDVNLLNGIMDKLVEGAKLHCSFGSVASVLGKKEGENGLVIPDEKLSWEGPPQVIELSAAADTVLVY